MDEKTIQKQASAAKENEKRLLSIRDRILKSKDITSECITIPEWDNVTIEIRSPTVRERGEMITEFMAGESSINDGVIDYVRMYPALVISCAFDPETGLRIFTPDDKDALRDRNSAVMERIGEVAARLSGLRDGQERIELGKDDSSPTSNGSTSSD